MNSSKKTRKDTVSTTKDIVEEKNKKYNPSEIEQKWQKKWVSDNIFSPNLDNPRGEKGPFYNLMMFPYPSAEGMHVGNMYAFTGADIYGRFKRMQGYEVFEPIGLDGFGIHSENYALKIGKHPADQAKVSEANFYRQLVSTGNAYDWNRTVQTYNPDYYKWTQWVFIQMFKMGLAYRAKAWANFCPSCKTVLADEQVISGLCERCKSQVEKRQLEQWFFKITDYAERLLNNIEDLNWTEKVKIAQRNWIGKSTGARLSFEVPVLNEILEVFTTRPDTLYGATFMVVSPEHPSVAKILALSDQIGADKKKEIEEYLEKAKAKTEIERTGEGKEKTGVFSGVYAINPVNGKKIPLWVADYVLMGYGTGAIMAVPAHDHRDFEFAKKYDLPIQAVIKAESDGKDSALPYTGQGILINSDNWNGLKVPSEITKVFDDLEAKKLGSSQINYHLRDWLISRQRYWGAPIPMVYCSSCAQKGESWFTANKSDSQTMGISNSAEWNSAGWFPVPDVDLPVQLPYIEDYKPLGTGVSPLASHPDFYNATCPHCGGAAKRETDVCDTFLDSSWYFFRYLSTEDKSQPFDKVRASKWLPVNMYIGGAEHSVLHLLYSRFVTMVFSDLGLINFEEPFARFFAHGLLIKEGAKMSKSKGNVVIPDQYISKYGADTLRSYLMFLGPFSQGGDFYDTGIEGMFRFLKRVWTKLQDVAITAEEEDFQVQKGLHQTIKEVTQDLEGLSYNTAIAKLMRFNNLIYDKDKLSTNTVECLLKMLSPFSPHMTEELWDGLIVSRNQDKAGRSQSIHHQSWPCYDEKYLVEQTATIVVQVNGKVRDNIIIETEKMSDQAHIEALAKSSEKVKKYLDGQRIKKTIYIPGKILNIVI